MQQRPEEQVIDLSSTRKLTGASSLAPVPVQTRYPAIVQPPVKRRSVRTTVVWLLLVGLLLAGVYLALYPLLAGVGAQQDAVRQAIPGLFPWVPSLYWTRFWLPTLSWLTPLSSSGSANLQLLLLAVATLLVVLAAWAGGRVAHQQLSTSRAVVLFWLIIILATCFCVLMFFAPLTINAMTRDMLLYGFYGRVVTVYHGNPYTVVPATLSKDVLQLLLNVREPAAYGPVWTDLNLLVALLARESIARLLIGFRIIAIIAHLSNAALIWLVLNRWSPQKRVTATILYSWNPLVLLLGVAMMHAEIVVLFFILLGILFFQRNSPTLGWVFILLSMLVNPLCLLLLPLFFRYMIHDARILSWWQETLWWAGMIAITALVIALAYAPYWQGWGAQGIWWQLRTAFVQNEPINSLNAALLHLPVQLASGVRWILIPHHWAYLMLIIVGCFLLFSLWLADTLELVVLFGAWLLLLLLMLQPVYWPWLVIMSLGLAAASSGRNVLILAVLLAVGGLISYYCWLLQPIWLGQGLAAIGAPLLIWGWGLFFRSTWQMARASVPEPNPTPTRRSSLFSRPSRPGRRG